jgi:hypothetical protein
LLTKQLQGLATILKLAGKYNEKLATYGIFTDFLNVVKKNKEEKKKP